MRIIRKKVKIMFIRTHTKNFHELLLGVSLSVLSSSIAVAQSYSVSNENKKVEEIVVTGKYLFSDQVNALKSPTPIIDVPQSLSIITANQITNQGFDSVGDIINYIPGVTNSQGEGHRDSVVFRGVRSTSDFFVDGVRDDVQYYRSLYNIDQVEILRGANALLFGRGGTGGLVNRVTKKGQIGEDFTGYKAAIDTFGAFAAEIDSNFAASDTSAFRINAIYESLNNHRDFYDGDRIAFNPTVRFELSPSSTVDLSYEYIDNERFIDRGIPINDLAGGDFQPVEAFENIVFGDPELNTAEAKAHILRATLTQNFSDNFKGVFNATYSDFDKLYQNFYSQDLRSLTTDRTSGIVRLDGYVDTTQRKSFNISGNLIGEYATGGIEHTIVTGIEYRGTSNNNDRFNPEFPFGADGIGDDREDFIIARPLNLSGGSGVDSDDNVFTVTFTGLNDQTESDIKVFSAFIQDEIAVSDNFDIILGGRFDSFDMSTDDIGRNTYGLSRTDEKFSPRAGLVFKPQENISVYGSYSQSFLPRTGEQFAGLRRSSPGSVQSDILSPDEFENLEAGLKWDLIDGLSFTASVFKNESMRASRADINADETEVQGLSVDGFELQLEGEVTDRLYVRAGYANLTGETSNGGVTPRELPKKTFSIWTNYRVTDKFGFGLGATHQGEALTGNGSATFLPAFTRFDAAAYYDVNDTFRVQINVENLTNTLYFPSSHSTHQATVGVPLNARISVSGRF
ncbi:TonB-dependent receptor [Hellea sp.]|nr:TonB-dependent receptor [Hellea sp.]